jgi:hypothetical protein
MLLGIGIIKLLVHFSGWEIIMKGLWAGGMIGI